MKRLLAAADVAFTEDPRLVRGLDYYTSTTFEFSSQALDAAQNGIGGGGRYDKLVEQMGEAHAGHRVCIGIELSSRLRRRASIPGSTRGRRLRIGMDNPSEVTLLVTELREDGMPNAPMVTARSWV